MTDVIVGERVRYFRTMAGMSQMELAEQCGITYQQIQKYESAQNRVSAGRLYQISQVFDVPVAAFFAPNTRHEQSLANAAAASPRDILDLIRCYNSIIDGTLKSKAFDVIKNIARLQTKGVAA
jgi:transcriptional regulator with XRE-family HTH domain